MVQNLGFELLSQNLWRDSAAARKGKFLGRKKLLFSKLTKDESPRSLKIPSDFLIVVRRKNPQGPVAGLWKQKSSDNLTIFLSLRNET